MPSPPPAFFDGISSRGAEPRVAEQARELLNPRYPYVYEFEAALALDPGNADLRRELDRTRMERDVLKKAIGIFAEMPK